MPAARPHRSTAPVIAAWCFQCGLDYATDVAECVECGVPTVSHPPTGAEALAEGGQAQLAYELHAWNGSARHAVEVALHGDRLAHVWQGPTLLVLEDDEDAVDEIIGRVDEQMATSMSEGVSADGGRVGFDLGARSEELHQAVSAQLAKRDIGFELMENGFLLVDTAVEDEVGDLIEAIQDELRSAHTFGPGVDGVEAHTVVESLFVAGDVLRRNPRDLRAQRQLLEAGSIAHDLQLPFGYEATMWRHVLDQVDVLGALIEDTGDDDLIEAEAGQLRNLLVSYV